MAVAKTDFTTSEGRDSIIQRVNSRYPEFNKRKARFIRLCRDMIKRVETSGDDGRAFLGVRPYQAGGLALSLGFHYPPIQVMTYLAHKNRVRILPEFGSLRVPPQWDDLKRRRPDIDAAVMLRVYDPGFPPDGHYRDLDMV